MAVGIPASAEALPIIAPPPGVTPNFIDPQSRADSVYIAAGVCMPILLLFSCLRFYVSLCITKNRARLQDGTYIAGMLGAILFTCLTVIAVSGGAYGRHAWDVLLNEFTQSQLILSLLVEFFYPVCLYLIKLALFVFYLEMLGRIKWFRLSVLAGVIVTAGFHVAAAISYMVMCAPRHGTSQAAYLLAFTSPLCTRTRPLVVVQGAFNVAVDLFMLVIPLPIIWSLQLPWNKKIGVLGMFLTGIGAIVASTFGLVYRVKLLHAEDTTWLTIPGWLTAIVEMTAGAIICCMPAALAAIRHDQKRFSDAISSYRKCLDNLLRSVKGSSSRTLVEDTTDLSADTADTDNKTLTQEKMPTAEQIGVQYDNIHFGPATERLVRAEGGPSADSKYGVATIDALIHKHIEMTVAQDRGEMV